MAEPKKRVPIDPHTAAQVLFLSDRTCCICQIPQNTVQIHHIDEDPSNNSPENLAILCLECHNKTQQSGGFGRQLDSHQVVMYRDEWLKRIAERRKKADELASEAALTKETVNATQVPTLIACLESEIEDVETRTLYRYILFLPELKRNAIEVSRPWHDTGGGFAQANAIHDVIEVMQKMLSKLLGHYDGSYFTSESPEAMVSRLVSQLSDWHNLIYRPDGEGTEGTMVYPWIYSRVLSDVDDMIVDVVRSLDYCRLMQYGFDCDAWEARWNEPTLYESK